MMHGQQNVNIFKKHIGLTFVIYFKLSSIRTMLITTLFYFVWRSIVEVKLDIDVSGVFFCVSITEKTDSPIPKM